MRFGKKETPVQPVQTPPVTQPVEVKVEKEVKPEEKQVLLVTQEQLTNSKLDDIMAKLDYLIEGLEKSE